MQHPQTQDERHAPSLFDRYGGSKRISLWVIAFYEKVRDSHVLAPYFRNTDFPRLLDHQTKYISSLLGGPVSFDDAFIAHAHKGLGIDRRAFDCMLRLFRETLQEFGVAEQDIRQIEAALESHARFIVAAKPPED